METEEKKIVVGEPSPGGLIRGFLSDVVLLARKESQLGRSEIGDKLGQLQQGATSFLIAGAILFFGVQLLLAAAVLGLSTVMSAWLSALIIGVIACAVGAILFANARRKFKSESLVPQATIESLEVWHAKRKHG